MALKTYKLIVPELSEPEQRQFFDIDEHNLAMEQLHYQVVTLDTDCFLLAIYIENAVADELLIQYYLREDELFSCKPDCSWCQKFGIERSRFTTVDETNSKQQAMEKLAWYNHQREKERLVLSDNR